MAGWLLGIRGIEGIEAREQQTTARILGASYQAPEQVWTFCNILNSQSTFLLMCFSQKGSRASLTQ